MSNRNTRIKIANQTLKILNAKSYKSANGINVDIADILNNCVAQSIHYTPEVLATLLDQLMEDHLSTRSQSQQKSKLKVFNETTFSGAQALLQETGSKVICLNFASAKNPGGGFLGGSQAQEESLARASGLYSSLSQYMSMYLENRKFTSCLYQHHMVYSPDVPVFRGDDDEILDKPWLCSIITAAAVNFGALKEHEIPLVEATMRQRIDRVLAITYKHGYKNLILGAWGCGVFKNKPEAIAEYFYSALSPGGRFYDAFENVRFSVLDHAKDQATYKAFKETLSIDQ